MKGALQVIAVLVCLLGASLADSVEAGVTTGLGFKAGTNVSASVTANGWQYRQVSVQALNTPLLSGFNYESISVNKTGTSINGDILVATAYVAGGGYPIAFGGFFVDSLQWSANLSSDFTSAAFGAAAGYLGIGFLEVYESTPSGTPVAGQSLKSALLAPSNSAGLSYSFSDHTAASDTLKYISFTGTNGAFSISFTFVASSVAGILNQSNIAVGPKSVECIISINGWNYASTNNSLNLLVGVATGSAKLAASGRTVYSANGTNQIFFSTGNTSTDASGNVYGVSVSIASNSTTNIADSTLASQVNAKYGAQSAYYIAKVTFPAGAQTIVYDPSVGEGTPVDDNTASSGGGNNPGTTGSTGSSASTVMVSLAALCLMVLVWVL